MKTSFIELSWPSESLGFGPSVIGVKDVVARLFAIIAEHKIIDGFVPPPIAEASAFVPNMRDNNTARADSTPGKEIKHPLVFGRLITEWPLPRAKDG